jgi:hypothetical protein
MKPKTDMKSSQLLAMSRRANPEEIVLFVLHIPRAFRNEIRKRGAIRNITMNEYVYEACKEFMRTEDSYNTE